MEAGVAGSKEPPSQRNRRELGQSFQSWPADLVIFDDDPRAENGSTYSRSSSSRGQEARKLEASSKTISVSRRERSMAIGPTAMTDSLSTSFRTGISMRSEAPPSHDRRTIFPSPPSSH